MTKRLFLAISLSLFQTTAPALAERIRLGQERSSVIKEVHSRSL